MIIRLNEKARILLLICCFISGVAYSSDSVYTTLYLSSGLYSYKVSPINSILNSEGIDGKLNGMHVLGGVGIYFGLFERVYLTSGIGIGYGISRANVGSDGYMWTLGVNYAFLKKNRIEVLGGFSWNIGIWKLYVEKPVITGGGGNVFVYNSSLFYGQFNSIGPTLTVIYNVKDRFTFGTEIGYNYTYRYGWTYPGFSGRKLFDYYPEGLFISIFIAE